jgi:hypothetical protein
MVRFPAEQISAMGLRGLSGKAGGPPVKFPDSFRIAARSVFVAAPRGPPSPVKKR